VCRQVRACESDGPSPETKPILMTSFGPLRQEKTAFRRDAICRPRPRSKFAPIVSGMVPLGVPVQVCQATDIKENFGPEDLRSHLRRTRPYVSVRRCTRDGQAAPPSDADRRPLPNTRAAAAELSTARTEGTAAAAPGAPV